MSQTMTGRRAAATPGLTAAATERWPELAVVPPGRGRDLIAAWLLRRIAARLPFRVTEVRERTFVRDTPVGSERTFVRTLPIDGERTFVCDGSTTDGKVRERTFVRYEPEIRERTFVRHQPEVGERTFGRGGPDDPLLVLRRPGDFYRRVGARGLIGLGESYMAGDWDCADLTGLVEILARDVDRLVPRGSQWLRRLYVHRPPASDDSSVAGAPGNISRHYDLSNGLFALFLDETMTYSSALFEERDGRPEASAVLLADAQRRKIDRLLDQAGVGPSSRVLELGTGWGELAIRAGRRGATVLTVTLSAEQKALAEQRIAAAGLAGRVTVELTDYRQVTGRYDAILSVEMIEAVGERYWPDYFTALDRLLAPGGKIALQSIIMPHRRMLATRRTLTWILKYVFPGGLIPSVTAIEQNLAARTRLHVADRTDFGMHYAETLRLWREGFCAGAEALPDLGFDEVFRRMWLLYLCYSEAGFRSGYLNVSQLLITGDGS